MPVSEPQVKTISEPQVETISEPQVETINKRNYRILAPMGFKKISSSENQNKPPIITSTTPSENQNKPPIITSTTPSENQNKPKKRSRNIISFIKNKI